MRISATALLVALAILGNGGIARSEPLGIQTRAVDLHTEDRKVDQVGRLHYRGGLELTSPDPRFGGL